MASQTDLTVGENCNTFYNSSGLLCRPDLVCDTCPGDEGPDVCQRTTGSDIGALCTYDSDCSPLNSECSIPYEGCTRGTCTCIEGYFAPVGTTKYCQPIKYLGESCAYLEECRRGVAYSTCQDNTCSCADGEDIYKSNGREYCYLSSAREICFYPSDCLSFRIDPDTGDCEDQTTCGCQDDYLLDGETCVAASFGESCEVNGDEKECEANSQCDDSSRLCVCAADTTWQTDYMHCVHDTAATHLTTGEQCNLDYDSENGLICDPTLVCDTCDGAGGPDVCQMPTAA